MKKIAVLTSGGDAPGMNAAIRAVVRNGIYNGVEIVGVKRGFCGLIEKDFVPMGLSSVADIILRGGTILHTARCDEFRDPKYQELAYINLRDAGIDGLVVIGGDGSILGAEALHVLGMPVMGVPATIDNDVLETDYTIGFDTALNTVISAIDRIRDTATSHEKNFIVEVMGRDSGMLALAAGLAGGAETVLIPEVKYSISQIVDKINEGHKRGKLHSIVVMAEGVGAAYDVAKEIKEAANIDIKVTILGHVQRGGNPTALDRINASRMGAFAVDRLLLGESRKITAVKGNDLHSVDISKTVGKSKGIKYSDYDLTNILSI